MAKYYWLSTAAFDNLSTDSGKQMSKVFPQSGQTIC